jgi:hypothetical protein
MYFDWMFVLLILLFSNNTNMQTDPSAGLTWINATCTELCTDTVILLQSFLKVENPQVVLAHGKMDTAKIIPEHASQAFT